MKRAEYIFYTLIVTILLIVLLAKSMLWPWAGTFLILTYCTLAFIIALISWFIYSVEENNGKRFFPFYGTIPFGLSIAIVLMAMIAKLQEWPWHPEAFRVAIYLFSITTIVLIASYKLIINVVRREYIKKLLLKVFIFFVITILLNLLNFEHVIELVSSPEANEQRKIWKEEAINNANQPVVEYTFLETREKVIFLVEQTWKYHEKQKFLDSISNGSKKLVTITSLIDTTNNTWLIKVKPENEEITYLEFLVNAQEMKILNPTGEL